MKNYNKMFLTHKAFVVYIDLVSIAHVAAIFFTFIFSHKKQL